MDVEASAEPVEICVGEDRRARERHGDVEGTHREVTVVEPDGDRDSEVGGAGRDVDRRAAGPLIPCLGVVDRDVLDLERAEDQVGDPDVERGELKAGRVVGEQRGLAGDSAHVRRQRQRDRDDDRVVLDLHVDRAIDREALQRRGDTAGVDIEQRLAGVRQRTGEIEVKLALIQRDVTDSRRPEHDTHGAGRVDRMQTRIDHDLYAGVRNDLKAVETDLPANDRRAAVRVARVPQEAAGLGQRVDVAEVHVGARRGAERIPAEAADAVAVQVAKALQPGRGERSERGDVDLRPGRPAGLRLLERGETTSVAGGAERQVARLLRFCATI